MEHLFSQPASDENKQKTKNLLALVIIFVGLFAGSLSACNGRGVSVVP
jgi:hypothetical protein